MSQCISSHGEFSSHTLDDLHTCTLCFVLDEDAIRAELAQLRTHSIALNTIGWNTAQALNMVPDVGRDAIVANPLDLNARLIAEVDRLKGDLDGSRNHVEKLKREITEVSLIARKTADENDRLKGELAEARHDLDIHRDAYRAVRRHESTLAEEVDNARDWRSLAEQERDALRAQVAVLRNECVCSSSVHDGAPGRRELHPDAECPVHGEYPQLRQEVQALRARVAELEGVNLVVHQSWDADEIGAGDDVHGVWIDLDVAKEVAKALYLDWFMDNEWCGDEDDAAKDRAVQAEQLHWRQMHGHWELHDQSVERRMSWRGVMLATSKVDRTTIDEYRAKRAIKESS